MLRRGFLGTILLAALVGCTSKSPPLPTLYPVKGRVVNSGAPVKGGIVKLSPVDNPFPYVIDGKVNDAGQFELSTDRDARRIPGVPEGKYRATYSQGGMEFGKGEGPIMFAQIVEIGPKPNDIVLDLKDRQ